jgi:hypothetical protein
VVNIVERYEINNRVNKNGPVAAEPVLNRSFVGTISRFICMRKLRAEVKRIT